MERRANASCRKLKPSEVEGKQRRRSNDCPVANGRRRYQMVAIGNPRRKESLVPPSLSLCH